jgi:hypothetical protein
MALLLGAIERRARHLIPFLELTFMYRKFFFPLLERFFTFLKLFFLFKFGASHVGMHLIDANIKFSRL